MNNYNPRQPTWFRFKDSREMEKFLFLYGRFSFNDETLENVSKDSLYSRIIEQLKENSKRGFSTPIILYDVENTQLFTGSIFEDLTVHLYENIGNSIAIVDMDYNLENDTLKITYTSENFISDDNVKTLFGNDIIGTGNITLFRHVITLRGTDSNDSTYSTIFTIYSSSNLKINSVQDLNKVLKPTDGMLIQVSTLLEGQHFSMTEYNGMQYNASAQVWKVGSVNSDVSKVSGKSYLQEAIFNVSSISNDEVIAL